MEGTRTRRPNSEEDCFSITDEILKLQKMQNVGLQSTIKSLREELDNTKSKQEAALDARLPPMTQKQILERLKKESII